jgi:hypothetical protein
VDGVPPSSAQSVGYGLAASLLDDPHADKATAIAAMPTSRDASARTATRSDLGLLISVLARAEELLLPRQIVPGERSHEAHTHHDEHEEPDELARLKR